MEKITPFDIPLLNNEVCRYLSLKDLARCVQVSKAWFDWFSPALWRDLDCHIRLPYVYVHTFARQQEHVRTMRNITMTQAGSVFAQVPCTSLQRLDFLQSEDHKDVRRAQLPVLRSLEKMPTLRHLQIVLALEHDNTYRYWIRALEAMPHLESLSLKCDALVNGNVVQQVLSLCSGLRCLSLKLWGSSSFVQEKDLQEYRQAQEMMETMSEMQLLELSLDTNLKIYRENIFHPLLGRCPRLERLDLLESDGEPTLQHLVKTLKENKLSRLRHLTIGDLWGVQETVFVKVLSHVACGFESLIFRGEEDGNLAVQPLIEFHSRFLARLDFSAAISFPSLLRLMTGLPCLRTITAPEIDEKPYESTAVSLLDMHWECLDLRCLRLGLGDWGYYAAHHKGWLHPVEKGVLDYLLSEIAKLTSLRELSIGSGQMSFYMGTGYLEQLAGLKQLEILDLTNTLEEDLGEDEAQWMAENWPRLLQVHEQHTSTSFRETLLEKRPGVEFVKGPSYDTQVSDD
ncbi:hypothetical protein BGX34_005071 [Mortierella sp. NVP85]|nr:hypothetical protein BGX34_005071 [Mortierella sp. NVP85]